MSAEKLQHSYEIINRADAKRLGLKRYFTGQPCHVGHIAERLVSNYCCWDCSKLAYQEYKENNLDKERLRYREYYRADPEKARAGTDKENEKRTSRAWFLKNKPKAYATNKRWRDKNPEKINECRSRHLERNPGISKVYCARRRSRKAGSGGSFTREDIDRILKIQNWKCAEPTCSRPLKHGYHIDHIMPISLGGSSWPRNIQCLCAGCNLRKHAKHPLEWARENGRFL